MIGLTEAGYAITGISAVLAMFSSLVRVAVTDMKRSKEIRAKLKENQAEMRKLAKSGDSKKLERAQKEMMELTTENMRMVYKPMIITIIPIILIFGWLGGAYGDLNPTMNVTVVSQLPANMTAENITVKNDGVYNASNNTITWEIGKAHTDATGEVSAELKVKPQYLVDLNDTVVSLTYSDKNGRLGPIVSSDHLQPVEGSNMTVERIVETKPETGKVLYRVVYGNIATNNVIFFPLSFDFLFIHIHNGMGWVGWYILCSVIVSLIINKITEKYPIELNLIKKKQSKVN
jgi:uncharacterized membrane protein (DUF106 family)